MCKGTEAIRCSGKCGLLLHIAFVKSDGKGTRAGGKQWKCESCKKDSSVNSKSSSDSTAITKDFLLSVVEELKGQLFAEITKKEDIKTSVNFYQLSGQY